ncbi:MAG: VWA domain-containing protein [Planctomycetia bacterium]|nr:VWA domain-containing protein [Planctomycetia bacterium]
MINSDDPRLTAYVLGELDTTERTEIEAALAASPELQAEVDLIRQTAALFDESLQSEESPALTNEQRDAIERRSSTASVELANRATSSKGSFWRRHVVGIMATSIAGLLLVALLLPSFQAARESTRRVADGKAEGERLHGLSDRPSTEESPDELLNDRNLPEELRLRIEEPNQAAPELVPTDAIGSDAIDVAGKSAPRDNLYLMPDAPQSMEVDASNPRFNIAQRNIEGFDGGFGFESLGDRRGGMVGSGADVEFEDFRIDTSTDMYGGMSMYDAMSMYGSGVSGENDEDTVKRWSELSRTRLDTPRIVIQEEEGKLGIDIVTNEENVPEVSETERLLRREAGDLGLRDNTIEDDKQQMLEERAKVQEAMKQLQPPVTRTWRRAQATPNASRLVIGDQDELLMEGMQANVMVDGFRARVLLDLYYFNDRGRQLEGNFKLRLPDDASLYYFAFGESAYEYRPQVDQLAGKGFLSGERVRAAGLSPQGILEAREGSWSKVKEARVVPREKAAHAYSETVRRRVDPALVEWSGAGMFNARVFPLMPNKLHRIVVGYDVNLQQVGDDFVYRLDLPEDVKQCMVDLNVSALPGTAADIQPATRPFVSSGRAYYHFDEVKDSTVELRFSGTGPVLLKGKDPQAGEFFAARVTPKLPAGELQAGAERATFLVDTSLSSRPDKFNVWLNLLESVLTKNRETMKHFSVLFFSIDSHWWKEADVDNTPENVDALMTYCHSLVLEGATDLRQALREATVPSWAPKGAEKTAPRDLFLLSDGAVTWGEMNVHQLSKVFTAGQTLFAYTTGMAGTSTATLEHLTRETGGAVFSIVNEDEIAAAATAHRSRPWKLIDVTMAGGTDLLVAGRPQTIYPGQSLLIVGRGEPDAEAIINVSRGEERSQVSIECDQVVESDLAARAYGQVAVSQLEDLGSTLEDVSVAYARHFRVTGQTCSLLMLDSEADYQRFNIKPEDDVFVVRSTPSADLIAKKLDELAEQLGDAKASVVAWLDKLQNTPGFQFELPTALRLAIDRLPQSAFDIEPPRLNCESHERGDFPKEFIEQLDSGKLEYDSVTAQADQLLKQHGAANGLKMLSNLIEQNPGDPVLTRDVAYSAIEWGLGEAAFPLLHRVASMRPYEPQSYIAMAQCLADIGHADLAMVYYEVALNARWHDRYKDIHDIAGIEYLRLLRRIQQGELSSHAPDYAKARLESLVTQTPVNEADLVITMMWNTDRTDVDLHVLEPTGEECFYNHPTTRIGGHVTRDVTEGLGPEMYTLPKAKQGSYKIMANYFGSDTNRTKVRTKVYITVYEGYGSKQERVEKKTITLSDQKEKRDLATVVIKK